MCPGMRSHQQSGGFGQRGHLPQLVDAFGQDRIGLEHVVTPLLDQQPELMYAVVVLAPRELEPIKAIADSPEARIVMTCKGFLEPGHPESLELEGDAHRYRERPLSMTAQARQDTRLVRVDKDRQLVSELMPDGFDDGNVVARIIGVKPEFHRLEAIGQDAPAIL